MRPIGILNVALINIIAPALLLQCYDEKLINFPAESTNHALNNDSIVRIMFDY